ncbi:MAG: aspartate kinase [Gemmatimonadaceae bacterium]
MNLAVYKFGGAALATPERVARAAGIVARATNSHRLIVVVSASGITTDALLAIATLVPTATDSDLRTRIARLQDAHEHLARAGTDDAEARTVRLAIKKSFRELAQALNAARIRGIVSSSELDQVLATGERLSATIAAAALRSAGTEAQVIDATSVLPTDGRHGHATPDVPGTTADARRELLPVLRRGVVPVIPGFVGRGPNGPVATLGRGGSDLSATLIATAMGARHVVLWKDVDGLLTGDPSVVPAARLIPHLTAREAEQLARLGAKVIDPRALVPIAEGTRVFVRPFGTPEAPGTEISHRTVRTDSPVDAVTALMDQTLLRIVGKGLHPTPHVLSRALDALHRSAVGASMVSQAASAYELAITIPAAATGRVLTVLRDALTPEGERGENIEIDARLGVATVGIVGSGIGGHPAVAARVLGVMAEARIAVLAVAQGIMSTSISIVVDATRAADAQRQIHDAFELHNAGGGKVTDRPRTDIILLGPGRIGRELLDRLADRLPGDEARLRVCAVVDRTGFVFEPRGLSKRRIGELRDHKRAGQPLIAAPGGIPADPAEAIERIAASTPSRPVVVDTTASDTGMVLETALALGCDIVLANQIPVTAGQCHIQRLMDAARQHGRCVRYEATLGAGLPVIDTLLKLQQAGDRITRIEGCPSGTLGFLFGEMSRGRPFSEALADAVAAGYTEPDPRVDLDGTDVARKGLILARLIGFRGDLSDVAAQSLVPEHLQRVPLRDFFRHVHELDESWVTRVASAHARGRVLRYRVQATSRSVSVGVLAVPLTDPLAALAGTDNQFSFKTRRHRHQPLVITGPGAGAEGTATAVYNDLTSLAMERAPDAGLD